MNFSGRLGGGTRRTSANRLQTATLLGLLAMILTAASCGPVVRALGGYIGRDDALIARLIAEAAANGKLGAPVIEAAAERAGSKVHSVSVAILGESGTEKAKAALTELACQSIAVSVQKGKWATSIDVSSAAFDAVRGEVQRGYGDAEITASVLSLGQSLWTGDKADDEAVRNVVCAAVGATF